MAQVRKFDQFYYSPTTPNDYYAGRQQRRRVYTERNDSIIFNYPAESTAEAKYRSMKGLPSVTDYSDPFTIPFLMEELDNDNRYGSVTKDIEALLARKQQILNPLRLREFFPLVLTSPVPAKRSSRDAYSLTTQGIIDLDDDDEVNVPVVGASSLILHNKPIEVIDLDEDDGDQIGRPDYSYDLEVSKMRQDTRYGSQVANLGLGLGPQAQSPYHADQERRKNQGNTLLEAYRSTSYGFQEVILKKPISETPVEDSGSDSHRSKAEKEEDNLGGETASAKSKGVYVGVQDDPGTDSGSGEDDGLGDIWREMNFALECSKDATSAESTALEQISVEEEGEECDHSFVLKDDLGYVCRVCGVIEKSIETIFDFQWVKGTKTTRGGYISQTRNAKDGEQVEAPQLSVLNASGEDFGEAEISVHPRHMKQMKPHQLEGFNFLLRNLVSDNPGGCILAHAPGSGKTFMIISFMQSFLVKYPNARPMVVLPKGILDTWKREFQKWQIEEIRLYDLYSSKADNREQQLVVLKQWVEQKGILFLGYKQFSNIVSNSASSKAAAACHDILIKVPTILILDEGHTPRNDTTDVLQSLAKVQTPRKVVLSGTLFQNHVKEVFNILNLVRPKFLKLDTSRTVVRRVMSRVQISGVRKHIKNGGGEAFFDLVEDTLQNDQDFRRKVTVIQDLREMTSKVLHYYKGDFLEELPGLVDLTVLLNLNSKQQHAVEKLRKMEKFKRSSMGSAVYVHPQLKEYSENSTKAEKGNINEDKIDALLDKVDVRDGVKAKFFCNMLGLCESTGEKLLVFSQYLLPLKFLERLVVKTKGWSLGKEIFSISGDSSHDQREWSMERFNNSQDAKVFFGSIKACGEGISLVGASRVIILDVHLNPSVTRQAIGRAFRPGQTRKVYIYRLVAADSPEEEDHNTCFRKELISKMWFEWSEYCGYHDIEMESVDRKDLGDVFWDSPLLGEDVKASYKR